MNSFRTRKRPAEREGIRRGELTATVDQIAAVVVHFTTLPAPTAPAPTAPAAPTPAAPEPRPVPPTAPSQSGATMNPNIQATIAELRSQRALIDTCIAGLEKLAGILPTKPAEPPTAEAARPARKTRTKAAATGAPGVTFSDVVREVLASKVAPASQPTGHFTNRAVLDAVRATGVETNPTKVAQAMHSLRAGGEVQLVRKDGATPVWTYIGRKGAA